MPDYRIDFTIQRREDGDEDFTDIGFGSSGASSDPGAASFEVDSIVQNYAWETEGAMPDPIDIKAAIEGPGPSGVPGAKCGTAAATAAPSRHPGGVSTATSLAVQDAPAGEGQPYCIWCGLAVSPYRVDGKLVHDAMADSAVDQDHEVELGWRTAPGRPS
jgi:hypothetical protein